VGLVLLAQEQGRQLLGRQVHDQGLLAGGGEAASGKAVEHLLHLVFVERFARHRIKRHAQRS